VQAETAAALLPCCAASMQLCSAATVLLDWARAVPGVPTHDANPSNATAMQSLAPIIAISSA